jgi:predicted kinase
VTDPWLAELTKVQRLVLVSGSTGSGKSTIANAIACDLTCAVGSFDWLMSALRSMPEIWPSVELPVERQREVGWRLLSRLAEQELRHGRSLVFDLVAREVPRREWSSLADRYGARFSVIECVCSDADLQRSRVEQRSRDIPGWYELTASAVERSRSNYVPLDQPKLVIDAVRPLDQNLATVRSSLGITAGQ